jgi:uncharacterized protein YaaW (UPF0174 family)
MDFKMYFTEGYLALAKHRVQALAMHLAKQQAQKPALALAMRLAKHLAKQQAQKPALALAKHVAKHVAKHLAKHLVRGQAQPLFRFVGTHN